MTRSIDRDVKRFSEIVRGRIRKDLRKYVNHGEMLGRKGRETVSIPVPSIDLPHFQHGPKGSGGAGQGEGNVGQPIGKGQDEGDGQGSAGGDPGRHVREVEVTMEELAAMLGVELELPRIEPKGNDSVRSKRTSTTPSPAPVPIRCGTSSGPTRKPSNGKLPVVSMTPSAPSSFPTRKMNASAVGAPSPSRRPTPPSFTSWMSPVP